MRVPRIHGKGRNKQIHTQQCRMASAEVVMSTLRCGALGNVADARAVALASKISTLAGGVSTTRQPASFESQGSPPFLGHFLTLRTLKVSPGTIAVAIPHLEPCLKLLNGNEQDRAALSAYAVPRILSWHVADFEAAFCSHQHHHSSTACLVSCNLQTQGAPRCGPFR